VNDLRRSGDPTATFTGRIKAGIAWVLGLFGLGGGATAVQEAGDSASVLDKASDALSLWERLQFVIAPLADLFSFALHWLWVPAILALLLAWILSRHCEHEHLAAYKSAKML
jgi:hypothetical protein